MGATQAATYAWDDNPASFDLLGYEDIVQPVAAALANRALDPLTIGIHAPWGGGKTTVLNLLEDALDTDVYAAVRLSPWEFDREADVRGEVIGRVLASLARDQKVGARVKERARGLLKRVSWGRVASVAVQGALLQSAALQEGLNLLGDLLNPASPDSQAQSMQDFRTDFEEMLSELDDVERVVVLVDDLDRCLPTAIVETFEAIKLFLSVKGMAFVIAADTEMVTNAVEATLPPGQNGSKFAQRYVEKIVQMPVTLPRLSTTEVEAYITMLYASKTLERQHFEDFVAHCASRRATQTAPYTGAYDEESTRNSHTALARQLAYGLRGDKYGSPREVKRFLNAFNVRRQLAASRGVTLDEAVLAKLYLLETQYPDDFVHFMKVNSERMHTYMGQWEQWAHGEPEAEKPENVSDGSRRWAKSVPSLAESDLDLISYVTLAATLSDTVLRLADSYSKEALEIAKQLSDESIMVSDEAREAFREGTDALRDEVFEALSDMANDSRQVDAAITGLLIVADAAQDFRGRVLTRLEDRHWDNLQANHVARMGSLGLTEHLRAVHANAPHKALKQAAAEELGEAQK